MPNYKYETEIITPLHIGSGEKIYPLEYIMDGGNLIRINMAKLFSEPSFQRERFINESKRMDFYLGDFDKNNAIKYPLYKIGLAADIANNLRRNIKTSNALILDFIKEGKNFYMPGSSIKGAIRTAILWALIKDPTNKNEFENRLNKVLAKKRNPLTGKKVKKKDSLSLRRRLS